MDPSWFLYNPLSNGLLNILFSIVLVVGIGLLVFNLVKLATSYNRTGPIIGLIISLFIIGLSVAWQNVLPLITGAMGGVVQYLTIYIYTLIYQWLAQQSGTTAAAAALLLL
jgi:Ca2+/Na+ antiporter